MGPKKKEKEPPVIEGYNQEEMTREQVEVLCYRLQEEMKKEREERAFFQLERDKVRAFWEVARRQLEEVLLEVRNKEHGRADIETERRRVLKFHDSNVKFLKNEFEKNVEFLKKERKVMLTKAKEEYNMESMRLRKMKRDFLDQLRSQQDEQQEKEEELKLDHKTLIEILLENNREELKELNDHFEKHLKELRESLTLKHCVEVAETEERHKLQIDTLLNNQASAMTELKNYYNEVTLNNLSLIASLKASCSEARNGRSRAMQEARALRAENKKLAGPLHDVRELLADMRRRMTNYHKDKKALQRAVARAAAANKATDDVHWEIDIMQIEIDRIREERELLTERLKSVQRRVNKRQLQGRRSCDRRVRELEWALQQRESEARSLIRLPEIICRRVQAAQPMLEDKNRRIAGLTLEGTRLQKAQETALHLLNAYLPEPASHKTSESAGGRISNVDFKIIHEGRKHH